MTPVNKIPPVTPAKSGTLKLIGTPAGNANTVANVNAAPIAKPPITRINA